MSKFTRETFARKFFKDNNLPFPVEREALLPYYATIDGFSSLVNDFNKYIAKVETVGYDDYIDAKDEVENLIIDTIKGNKKYQDLLAMEIKQEVLPIDVSRNLYIESNCNKPLLSIDMKNANFTMLFSLGVVSTYDWNEWMSQFTSNDELIKSKRLRQIVLGKLNNKRLEKLMKNEMIKGATSIKNTLSLERIVAFNKDEIVYDVSGLTVNNAEILSHFTNCQAKQFVLKKLTRGFVKEYNNGEFSFHSLPKKYWLQTYKEYKGLPTVKEDFLFLDEDRNLCLRLEY